MKGEKAKEVAKYKKGLSDSIKQGGEKMKSEEKKRVALIKKTQIATQSLIKKGLIRR